MKRYYMIINNESVDVHLNDHDLGAFASARLIIEVKFDYRTGQCDSRIIKNNMGPKTK